MKTLKYLLAVLFTALIFAQTASASQHPAFRVSFGFFYENLRMHGQWIELEDGLIVWRPGRVTRTWQPYMQGTWVYTNYGWYWDSFEDYGHIVYHYGRWYYDEYYGWLWVPDYEWAPAWVEWRFDNDYIGWVPLHPYAVFNRHQGLRFSTGYAFGYTHWHFVHVKHFCSYDMVKFYAHPKEKYRLYRRTVSRTNYVYRDNAVRNYGIEREFIDRRVPSGTREREIVFTGSGAERGRNSSATNRIEVRIPKEQSYEQTTRSMEISRGERNIGLRVADINSESREEMNRIREQRKNQGERIDASERKRDTAPQTNTDAQNARTGKQIEEKANRESSQRPVNRSAEPSEQGRVSREREATIDKRRPVERPANQEPQREKYDRPQREQAPSNRERIRNDEGARSGSDRGGQQIQGRQREENSRERSR